jgi:hypothetical protein
LLTRREALARATALLGGIPLVGAAAWLGGCTADGGTRPGADGGVPPGTAAGGPRPGATARFTTADIAFLDDVADTILPETSTPGARAAGVGPFMALMVTDTYDEEEQRIFRGGLRTLDDECRALNGVPFASATPPQRLALLERLDREQFDYTNARRPGDPPHYFRMIKELTLLGYFTSEIGYTQAMRYVETPRRFDPCVPYSPGDKLWAPHA